MREDDAELVTPAAAALLAALLRIPADDAARIRSATPARIRPRPQSGPSADYGEPDDGGSPPAHG